MLHAKNMPVTCRDLGHISTRVVMNHTPYDFINTDLTYFLEVRYHGNGLTNVVVILYSTEQMFYQIIITTSYGSSNTLGYCTATS